MTFWGTGALGLNIWIWGWTAALGYWAAPVSGHQEIDHGLVFTRADYGHYEAARLTLIPRKIMGWVLKRWLWGTLKKKLDPRKQHTFTGSSESSLITFFFNQIIKLVGIGWARTMYQRLCSITSPILIRKSGSWANKGAHSVKTTKKKETHVTEITLSMNN